MGEALISRLISSQTVAATAVIVSDPLPARRDALTRQYGLRAVEDNGLVVQQADVVVLAVKPQVVAGVAAALPAQIAGKPPLLLSILAGTPLAQLEDYFPGWPVVRAMPNTPATVGAGVTALAQGSQATAAHLQQAETIFASVGQVLTVPERLMDAVTALSGSGPGYVALVVEALTDGGVAAGLPRATAAQLALQTVRGTAELLHHTQWHPAELKDRVTSPGGTTIAGVAKLEERGLRSALIEAVKAAAERSKQLGS